MTTVNIPEEILDDNTLSLGAFKVYCKIMQYEIVPGVKLDDMRLTTTFDSTTWNNYVTELNDKGYTCIKEIFNHEGTLIKRSGSLRTRKAKDSDITRIAYYLDEKYCLNRFEKRLWNSDKIVVSKDGKEFESRKEHIASVIEKVLKMKKLEDAILNSKEENKQEENLLE